MNTSNIPPGHLFESKGLQWKVLRFESSHPKLGTMYACERQTDGNIMCFHEEEILSNLSKN